MSYLYIDLYDGETRYLTEEEFKEQIEECDFVKNPGACDLYKSEEYMVVIIK